MSKIVVEEIEKIIKSGENDGYIQSGYYNEDKTIYTIEYNDGLIETNYLNPIFKDNIDLRAFSNGEFEFNRYNDEGEKIYHRDIDGIIWLRNENGSFVESK